MRILANGRSAEAWKEVEAGLPGAVFVQGDLSKPEDRERVCEVATKLGPVSILVTNAGGPPTGQFEEITSAQWRAALETSFLGILEITRVLLPAMKRRGYGRIINITSFVVKELYPNMSLSNSIRVGLTGAMGSIARECAQYGVTINGILPGLMDTGALQRVIRDRASRTGISEECVAKDMAESVPMRRLGAAEDFGPICAFLASRQASYITGQNICIDGGLTKSVI